MNLYPIESGHFKLDGGAMFGVVPKSLWSRTNPADANNMIELATRCLLVEDANRLILIDNGFGQKQDEKFFKHYHLWGDHTLTKSLSQHGFHKDDITDVFLTHLHFDHCGGAVRWNEYKTASEHSLNTLPGNCLTGQKCAIPIIRKSGLSGFRANRDFYGCPGNPKNQIFLILVQVIQSQLM